MENGYIESFNAKLSDELLNGEIFDTQLESQVLVEWVRRIYDTIPSTQMAGVSTTGSRESPAYGFGLRGYALPPSAMGLGTNKEGGAVMGAGRCRWLDG